MAYYFNEAFYVASKLGQLVDNGERDPVTGNYYTEGGLYRAFAAARMTPQEHYERYGRFEGLNPNEYFSEAVYLNNKLGQLQSTEPQNNWTLEKLNAALEAANLTPVEHYEQYGCYEKDAGGNFISPSEFFNPYYYANKLDLCWESGETVNGKTGYAITLDDVVSAFQAAKLSPISHFVQYGEGEGLTGEVIPPIMVIPEFPWEPITFSIEDAIPSSDSDAVVKLVGVDLAENEYGALTSDDFSGA